MKILIATGIYPPDIGGPATYSKLLKDEFVAHGHDVRVISYRLEKKLPMGVRHLLFFLRTIFTLQGVDMIIALDTFSVGLPTFLASKLFHKKVIVRTGGDFLWESYVARTVEKIYLSEFYQEKRNLSQKEKIIFTLTKYLLKNTDAVVFSTDWQRRIFVDAYELDEKRTFIIENFYGEKLESTEPKEKNFLWAGRDIALKNLDILKEAFEDARKIDGSINLDISGKVSRDALLEKIKKCYAVILPSVSEVSPNFILEALLFDKPFTCTKDTGLYDKLKDLGNFVDPLNTVDIKEKILYLANDDNYKENRNKIASFYFTHSYKQIAREFLDIYKKI